MRTLWLIFVCGYMWNTPSHAPAPAQPLLTTVTYVDGCANFPPQDLKEDNWDKSHNTTKYTLGDPKGLPIHIAQITLLSGKVQLQHVSLVCKLVTTEAHVSIIAASISSIGGYPGGVTIRSHDAHTFMWTAQANRKSHGFDFDVEFWGKADPQYSPGSPKPYVYCANPRAMCTYPPGPGK